MRALRGWVHRVAGLLRPSRRAREAQAELESHLQLHIDDNRRRGLSPDEARRQALIALGGVAQTTEAYADQGTLPLVETVLEDVRFAWRLVRRNPAFSAIVIVTLGIGIGANSVMFSVVNALLLQPLPYGNADRLVAVQTMESGRWRPASAAPPDFYEYRERNRSFDGVMSYSVAQRSREIGIRLALGAARRDVVAVVMRQGLGMVAAGIVVGLAASLALTGALRSLLFAVSPTDPLVFTAITVLLTSTAAVATYVPARRAARLDPLEMLRSE